MLADAALIHNPVEIFEDGGRIGNRLFMLPWLEIEAKRMHVAVRADAGITEQIPRPAQILAHFYNGIGKIGALQLHMRCHPDAGNAGSDDQNVMVRRDRLHALSPNGGEVSTG